MSLAAHPYRYPSSVSGRKHGPAGYRNHREYRPWLEDEFVFRCVYCLKRQKWAPTDIWSVDHLVPQSKAPERVCDYTNLVLTCQWCNNRKLAHAVPDPVAVAYGNFLQVQSPSGEVRALNEDGEILLKVLRLNDPPYIRERSQKMRDLALMARCAPSEWKRLMGFPDDLPNLKRKSPPEGNAKPEGLDESWHSRRLCGKMPEFYE